MSALALDAAAVGFHSSMSCSLSRATTERYVDAAVALLHRDGLTLAVNRDMRRWAAFLQAAPGNAGVNPTFDPDFTGPHEDAYWIEVRDGDAVVAVATSRLISCPGYYDFVRQGLLWSRPPGRPVAILIAESGWSGAMSHSGGLWVHPDARGSGLSWIVPRLNQAISQLMWPIENVASVIFSAVHDRGLPATYGAHRCRRLIEGYFWPTERTERIFSAEYPGPHLLARAQRDLNLLHEQGDKQMRHLALMARQGNSEATVCRAAAV